MSRLFLMLTAGVFLAIPPLFASGADPQQDQDRPWKSLHSVVSHRGVRVNMVQPPPAPAAEPVEEDTAPDEAAAPELSTPEVTAPDLSLPEAPAAESDTIEPPVATEAAPSPADEEAEDTGDESAPQSVAAPESCGPVRARISDLGQPDAMPAPHDVAPMPQTPPAQNSSFKPSDAPCSASVCGGSCDSAGRGLRGRRRGGAAAATGENPHCFCQMPQHYAYYPEMHGYYYFRPYNWTHIAEHQRITSQWGEDPRNPYGRQMFEQVYADYLAEQEAEAEPVLDLEDPLVPLPPEGN